MFNKITLISVTQVACEKRGKYVYKSARESFKFLVSPVSDTFLLRRFAVTKIMSFRKLEKKIGRFRRMRTFRKIVE